MVVGVTTATPRGANLELQLSRGGETLLWGSGRGALEYIWKGNYLKIPYNHLLSDSAECLLEG